MQPAKVKHFCGKNNRYCQIHPDFRKSFASFSSTSSISAFFSTFRMLAAMKSIDVRRFLEKLLFWHSHSLCWQSCRRSSFHILRIFCLLNAQTSFIVCFNALCCRYQVWKMKFLKFLFEISVRKCVQRIKLRRKF